MSVRYCADLSLDTNYDQRRILIWSSKLYTR